MKSVEEALDLILDGVEALDAEQVPLDAIVGRIAAADHVACVTQPPFSASAMDGYAVRFVDIATRDTLQVIGEAPAGQPFDGRVEAGTAVRVFTGAVIPEGADHVVIQEDVTLEGATLTIVAEQKTARNIRPAGLDFKTGDVLAEAGKPFGIFHGALLAAGNLPTAKCVRKPHIALFTSGDELRAPGADLAPGEIINSNPFALRALIEAWGGTAEYLGCAPDGLAEVQEMFQRASGADLIVPIGGASVGKYDFMRDGFAAAGGALVFQKVAVRPGKPTWFGRLGASRVIGLPGNPASAMVTASLFVQPLVQRLCGRRAASITEMAVTMSALPANGMRESYLRAERVMSSSGQPVVKPFPKQDSSLLSAFTRCDVLIRRVVDAPGVPEGREVEIIPITGRMGD